MIWLSFSEKNEHLWTHFNITELEPIKIVETHFLLGPKCVKRLETVWRKTERSSASLCLLSLLLLRCNCKCVGAMFSCNMLSVMCINWWALIACFANESLQSFSLSVMADSAAQHHGSLWTVLILNLKDLHSSFTFFPLFLFLLTLSKQISNYCNSVGKILLDAPHSYRSMIM